MTRLLISTLVHIILAIFHISRHQVMLTGQSNDKPDVNNVTPEKIEILPSGIPVVTECITPDGCEDGGTYKKCFKPDTWFEMKNTAALRGKYYNINRNREDCLEKCFMDSNCLFITIHIKEPNKCQWYYDDHPYTETHEKYGESTSYRKRKCKRITNIVTEKPDVKIIKHEIIQILPSGVPVVTDCITPEHCQPKGSIECKFDSWIEQKNTAAVSGKYSNINRNRDDCLERCFVDSSCLLITINIKEPNKCQWYYEFWPKMETSDTHEETTTFVKKSCKGIENIVTEKLDVNNVTPENTNFYTTKISPMIPVDGILIFNPQVQCLPPNKRHHVANCKEKAWQIIEYFSVSKEEISYETKYKAICCVFNKALPKEYENKNLIIADNLNKICRKVLEDDVNKCILHFNVWEREFHVKMTNAHSEQSLSTAENCLNNCLTKDDCTAVSIDFDNKKCFHFTGKTFNKIEGVKNWMSFFIKCCGGLAHY